MRFLAVVIALAAAIGGALAQGRSGSQDAADPARAYDHLPPELRTEALDVRDTCDRHSLLSTYQDCACYTQRFIDARLAGNKQSANNIVAKTGTLCPNRPGIVKREYETCMKYVSGHLSLVTPEEAEPVCRCAGEKAADFYIAKPVNSTGYYTSLSVRARSTCGTAGLLRLHSQRGKEQSGRR